MKEYERFEIVYNFFMYVDYLQGDFYAGKLNSYKEIFYVCKCLRDSFLGRAKYEYHSIRFNSFVILVVPIGTGFFVFFFKRPASSPAI